MSAIKNYVHLNSYFYLKYGAARAWTSPEPIYESYKAQKNRNAQRINSLKTVSSETLNILKKRMENNSSQKEAHDIVNTKYKYNNNKSKLEQTIKETILKEIPEVLEKYNINSSTFSSSNFNMQSNSIDDVKLSEAKKARKRVLENINRINSYTDDGKPTPEETINTLNKNINDFFNNLGIINNGLYYKVDDLKNLSMRGALTDIIRNISLKEASDSFIKGKYGEALFFTAGNKILKLGTDEVINSIEDALETGEEKTKFQITESQIPKSIGSLFKNKKQIKYNLYKINETQNKVDGSIELIDDNGISNIINASVKAYTPVGSSLKPHLQDVNLLTNLLVTEGQFASHWLNLHAHRIESSKRREMDELLKQNIMYEALVHGNLLKQGVVEADTFVMINLNASPNTVKVMSTKEMLTSKVNNFDMNPQIESIIIENKKAETWEQRIATILNSLHQQKIKVQYIEPLSSFNK